MSKREKIDEKLLQQMIAGNIPVEPLPEPIKMPEKEPVTKELPTDFIALYLCPNELTQRVNLYISAENYEKVSQLVRLWGQKRVSISGYIDNVLTRHFETHRSEIKKIYKKLLTEIQTKQP